MAGIPRDNRPVILTYHDIGMNHKTCFDVLFYDEDMQEIMRHFAVCQVNAPGQHEGASTFPAGFTYPSMDKLSETLPIVLKHFKIKSVIGMGVGAGANILTRFALKYPDLVEGLVLMNINAQAEGWADRAASKISSWALGPPSVVISHLFGQEEIKKKAEFVKTFRHNISKRINQTNLLHFMKSYNSRSKLNIKRTSLGRKTLKCHTLLVVGDDSPVVDAVVDCNSKMNPSKTTLLKMADCGGLPQLDQPGKLAEALKYFIQGLGYMSSAGMTHLSHWHPTFSTRMAFFHPWAITSMESTSKQR
ncbi:protein NDRG1-like [Electrophorus electricus]|uniref:protein NDRG1-like n=1 Tax=Electrophorus electricus TaxID=8005 RepID=UPI0015D0327C|nr:protein NDRG1-like [Electrophorus electricus]